MMTGTSYPGDIVGDYILGERLGIGSTAQVFALANRHEYVAKVINKRSLRTKKIRLHTVNDEIRTMSKLTALKYGNFIKLHCADESEHEYFLIMNRAHGGSLENYRKHHAPDYQRISEIVFGVVYGLSIMHRHGFIHRDIKPANILLLCPGKTSTVVIADFGLTMPYELERPWDSASGYAGSPGFMPPEACNGESYGPSFDMWSVGVFILYFFNKSLPWESIDREAGHHHVRNIVGGLQEGWYEKHLEQIHDENAKDFVSQCLKIDPKKRLTAIDAMSHAFLESHQISKLLSEASFKDNTDGKPSATSPSGSSVVRRRETA